MMRQILSYKNVGSLSIWLSEMDSHIYSNFTGYKGVDPYVMETRSIQNAFKRIKNDFPRCQIENSDNPDKLSGK